MIRKVKAAHILVETEEEANKILAELEDGKDFSEIAKEKSLCPSKEKGGNLGLFKRGQMVQEFEDACFAASPGDIVGPIKTQFGYHVIKVIEQR